MTDYIVNGIGHFDIAGPDSLRLGGFYAGVFGWRIDSKGPGYALVETPAGTPRGAIVEQEQAALTIGIVVADLDASIEAAIEHGGAVAMQPIDNGWVKKAMVVDPAGNRLTVIQS